MREEEDERRLVDVSPTEVIAAGEVRLASALSGSAAFLALVAARMRFVGREYFFAAFLFTSRILPLYN